MYIVNECITHDSSTFKYYQNSLVPGQHTLVLSGDSTPPAGPFIDLDSIVTFDATGTGVPTGVSSSVMLTPAPTSEPTPMPTYVNF